MIKLKRVYDPPSEQDGFRVLVDQLWPRGVRKEDADLDRWMKEVAPSQELRQWFGHDPEKWAEFKERYFAELDAHPEAWAPLVKAASKGTLTLLYSAREREHNNAVALRAYLESKLKDQRIE
jgi:uncharacterized protein YeaO (DUF488 family)